MRFLQWIRNGATQVSALAGKWGTKENYLQYWLNTNQIHKPINKSRIAFVSSEGQDLNAFSTLCHCRVQDREVSFTLEKRIRLYRRWLSTNQPCLLAITDGGNLIISSSVVLPLTAEAYDAFCSGQLDALDIEPVHIVGANSDNPYRYLLVDILATDRDMIREMPGPVRDQLLGIGFRALLYHISQFLDPRYPAPIIICSTANKPLARLLKKLRFEETQGSIYNAPIYKADLSRLDFYPPDVRRAFSVIFDLANLYRKKNAGGNA